MTSVGKPCPIKVHSGLQAQGGESQLPTAPVPQMRGKGVVTASTGRAENPERIIDSSKKPKPTTGKQPDARSQATACHKAKKAKPSVKPDVSSFPSFCAHVMVDGIG